MGSSLSFLVKNWSKSHSKYFSQECDSKILDLNRQKGFYSYEYLSGFEKFKRELPPKEEFYRSFTGIKTINNEYRHVINVSNKLGNEKNERLSQLS